jgi:cell division protein FtsL
MTLDKYLATIVGFILTTVAGFITWLVRTVLTNQKQIALLQEEISSRDSRREEDRSMWKELKDDVKEIKRDILDIYKKHKE